MIYMITSFLDTSIYFGAGLTILGLVVGLTVKRRVKSAVANPLLIAIVFVILALRLTGADYESYKTGAQPLTYLLTPATVCLAIPLYKQLGLLRRNWAPVVAGVVAGVLTNLICVYLSAVLFRFSHEQYATLLPKSVTTAIGIPLSEELGGVPAMTVASIIVTGIFGNIAAEHILNLVRVRDPVARGIAIGTGAHAIGTARALELGETEGAMGSLAIVLTGVLTVLLAPLFASFL